MYPLIQAIYDHLNQEWPQSVTDSLSSDTLRAIVHAAQVRVWGKGRKVGLLCDMCLPDGSGLPPGVVVDAGLRHVRGDDVLQWLDKVRYDATVEGASHVSLVCPNHNCRRGWQCHGAAPITIDHRTWWS